MPTDADAPPAHPAEPEMPAQPVDEAPVGFWADMVEQMRAITRPPLFGFFATGPEAPIQGVLQGDRLLLVCRASHVLAMVNKPDILQTMSQKASAMLGRKITVLATDKLTNAPKNEQMEALLEFGRAHSDIIRIK